MKIHELSSTGGRKMTGFEWGRAVLVGIDESRHLVFDTSDLFEAWLAQEGLAEIPRLDCKDLELEENTEYGVLVKTASGMLGWVGTTWLR